MHPSRSIDVRARVNILTTGTLLALGETGAVVKLTSPQPPARQTTLTLEGLGGRTLHIPASVLRSIAYLPQHSAHLEHHVVMAFFPLPPLLAAHVRRLVDTGSVTRIHVSHDHRTA